jgi:hypothetical protein
MEREKSHPNNPPDSAKQSDPSEMTKLTIFLPFLSQQLWISTTIKRSYFETIAEISNLLRGL